MLSLIETYPTLSSYFSQLGINPGIKRGIYLNKGKDSSSENVCPQNIMEYNGIKRDNTRIKWDT
jgi:hypothetical protein